MWRSTCWAASPSGSTAGQFQTTEWRRRQAASLVKLLALAPRRTLHREQVIDALWPDTAIDDAGPRLHKAAHFARRVAGRLEGAGLVGGHRFAVSQRHVVVDVEEFERSAKQAIAVLDRDPEDAEGSSAAATATDRWAGELLPDDPYEAWLEVPRDRLRQLHQELLRRSGRWAELALADPADEEASLARARQLADKRQSRSRAAPVGTVGAGASPRTGRQTRTCGGVTAGRVARIRRSREATSSGESALRP